MIKSNIDLTSNEIFSRNPISIHSLNIFNKKFPWSKLDFQTTRSEADLQGKFEGIVTGNRETREMKMLCQRIDEGNHCDCCGESLVTLPWDRTWGLCKDCLAEMESRLENRNKSKFPWKVDREMRASRRISLNW